METIKERNKGWQEGTAKNITFIVTKDCQLACKYCYLVGKNTKERMSWEVAKAAIDYILDHEEEMMEEERCMGFHRRRTISGGRTDRQNLRLSQAGDVPPQPPLV